MALNQTILTIVQAPLFRILFVAKSNVFYNKVEDQTIS